MVSIRVNSKKEGHLSFGILKGYEVTLPEISFLNVRKQR